MPHYVKKLWEKNYWHELRSVRVIAPITMTVIFFERWEGVAIEVYISVHILILHLSGKKGV